ncbi:hypothetical protein SPHINGOR109_50708 [Sphingorhabdus sp. 109]|jgi:hypothetical protein|nr:hypothetical protein [uncultured Parasphingorhabdus sp.]VWX60734.1 hypothetical protein SPHINGOR109_50708 [Sphingorhabdus sp. 109]
MLTGDSRDVVLSPKIHTAVVATFQSAKASALSFFEQVSVNKMTLVVEVIVGSGVDVEEALGGAGGFKTLHLSFSSSHWLMGISARLFARLLSIC